jgi:hypothetical protein
MNANAIVDTMLESDGTPTEHRVDLPKALVEKCRQLPETAMGSQKVNLVLNNGETIKNVTVFNCDHLMTKLYFSATDIKDIEPAI